MMYFLTLESDIDDKNCNMQKSWNSFKIDICRGRIVARSGLFVWAQSNCEKRARKAQSKKKLKSGLLGRFVEFWLNR